MIRVTRTVRDTQERLAEGPALAFARKTDLQHSVMVDPAVKYQEIEGFGGAFTEAAADTFRRMPATAKKEILTAYFDPVKGHGYTVCRTHINSCDFGLGSYAYDMVDGDVTLKHFSIERDQKAVIPMILAAQKAAGGKIKLFASPWSPPPWMKTNGDMCHGGKLLPEYRPVWANYYIRYLQEYQKAGVDLWGMTVQNECEANQPFDSCLWTGEEERDFVRDHLGPALAKNGFGHLRLMVWDHNRDRMYERAKLVYDDPAAAKYVWGTAYHWYEGECFDNVQRVHEAWPEKKMLFTEGCVRRGPPAGQWEDGEKYGHHMIQDLNRWTVGWTDWNLLLDWEGGPRNVPGRCSSPILADADYARPVYQPSYWYMGHFTRFIRPGARRIVAASSRADLETTAFVNRDKSVAVVVLNRGGEEVPFALKFAGAAVADTVSPPHSIITYGFAGRK
jgi:glucosylceramidase